MGELRSPFGARFPALSPVRSVELKIGGAPPPGASYDTGAAPPSPLLPLRGWPALTMRVPFSMALEKAELNLECLGVRSR